MGTWRSWHPLDVQEGFAEAPSPDNIATRPIPVTIDEWVAAARCEIQGRKSVLASLGPRNEHLMARRDRLKKALRRLLQRPPKWDPDAMGVDAAMLGDGSRNGTGEHFGGISETE